MIRMIKPTELKDKLSTGERLQLIDVRSPGEYASGHIPGTVNMPLEQVDTRLDDLHSADPVVIVCQSGGRASMCYENLKGYRDDLFVLEGGTSAWMAEGLPAVSSTASRWAIERQVRLAAGLLVLMGTALSIMVSPAWIYLAMFVGAGLTFAGLTNVCGMAALFGAMPWNKVARSLEGVK
ncbi:MAG: rhodanese-like domain-containing protein [Fimbriimonadaceae bacterium]|nr:rhodanese-like domain-containing protein [Fimbriimonadaceae bacterium]